MLLDMKVFVALVVRFAPEYWQKQCLGRTNH